MNGQKGLISDVFSWFAHPFQPSTSKAGSALYWVLWVGILAIVAFWWWHIINSITD